jgi:hypothetical protein
MIMSNSDPHQKVRADHLKRDAYLYIRQSMAKSAEKGARISAQTGAT